LAAMSRPWITWPKMVYCPSRSGAGAKVMKNWLPLEFGPELAMPTRPGLSKREVAVISLLKA